MSAHVFALWAPIDRICNNLSFTKVGLKQRQILSTGDTRLLNGLEGHFSTGGVCSSNFRWASNPSEPYCSIQLTNPTVNWTPPGFHSPNLKVLCVRVYILNRQQALKYCFMWSDMPLNFPQDLKITDICWRKRTKLIQQLLGSLTLCEIYPPFPRMKKNNCNT